MRGESPSTASSRVPRRSPDVVPAEPAGGETTRRRLLAWVARLSAGGAALAVAGPGLGFLLGPLRAQGDAQWVALGEPAALQESPGPQPIRFRYEDRTGYRRARRAGLAWAVGKGDALRVLSPVCTHKGCNVDLDREAGQFACPCHGGRYDLRGNVVAGPPPQALHAYETKVTDGRLWIRVGSDGSPA